MIDQPAYAPRRRLADLVRDTDALPLLFNVDIDGHEYATDLLDLAQEKRQ